MMQKKLKTESGISFNFLDLKIDCDLDLKTRCIRFVITNKVGDSEIFNCHLKEIKIINSDIENADNNPSALIYRHAISNSFPYILHVGHSRSSCIFDSKACAFIIALELSEKICNITKYALEEDVFKSEMADSKSYLVSRRKKWFKKWVMDKCLSKINNFIYISTRLLIGTFNTNHASIFQKVLFGFSRKSWASLCHGHIGALLTHKIFFDMNLEDFSKIFPNLISIKCIGNARVSGDKIQFKIIIDEEEYIFDNFYDFLLFNTSGSNSDLKNKIKKYANIPMNHGFTNAFHNIHQSVIIEDRTDYVQAVSIAFLLFEECEFSGRGESFFPSPIAIGIEVNDTDPKGDNIECRRKVFLKLFNMYKRDKNKFINDISKYLSLEKNKTNKKLSHEKLVSLYPSYAFRCWSSLNKSKKLLFKALKDDDI